MQSAILDQEEVDIINQQFGAMLRGTTTRDGVLLDTTEFTMHTDTHNDNHTDHF
jgi:hypothetical protein